MKSRIIPEVSKLRQTQQSVRAAADREKTTTGSAAEKALKAAALQVDADRIPKMQRQLAKERHQNNKDLFGWEIDHPCGVTDCPECRKPVVKTPTEVDGMPTHYLGDGFTFLHVDSWLKVFHGDKVCGLFFCGEDKKHLVKREDMPLTTYHYLIQRDAHGIKIISAEEARNYFASFGKPVPAEFQPKKTCAFKYGLLSTLRNVVLWNHKGPLPKEVQEYLDNLE